MAEVDVNVTDGVAVLTIDRPAARNAIGLRTIEGLHKALDDLANVSASVLVIRGAGERAFISGGDLKELDAVRDETAAVGMATRMRRLLDRLSTFPLPVVAALNGHAVGGGAEVAAAADIRIAADDVRIGFTQVKLAIMPAWGGAERLAEIVGRSQALLLVGTGQTLTAHEAARIGLVDRLTSRADFDSTWRSLAHDFARLTPRAARSIKQVIAAAKPNHHPDLEPEAVRAFAQLWLSDEHWQAAVQAHRRPDHQAASANRG
jgi:enoyl-CoA hydratase